jgi:putative MATE family efflux protein
LRKTMNLLEDNIFKLFAKFAATSIAGMLMVSLYILFDTIIVGQGVGKDGLAALNISIPIYNLIFGTGILIGTGGATAMSISIGAGRMEKANKAFDHAVVLGIIVGVVYTIFGTIFLEEIAYFLGASPATLPMVKEYLGVIVLFSWAFLMVYNLAAIVRNDHGPKRSMIALGAGGVVNVVFDYIFVFPLGMGMRGTAIATVMSAITSLIILLFHFIGGHSSFKITSFKLHFSLINRIISIGIASFIVEVSSGIVIFLFNRELLGRIGEIGVSAYSIIANVSLMCVAIFTGIAQGIQPIASTNYGAGKYKRIYAVRRLGMITAIVFGVLFFLAGMLMPEVIVAAFTGEKGQIVDLTKEGIRYYFLAFPLMGINLIMGSYFQAIEKTKYSTAISLCRGIIFTTTGLKLLSNALGVTGIWITVPAAEVATLVVVFIILYRIRQARAVRNREAA